MEKIRIKVWQDYSAKGLPLPTYKSVLSAGADLYANVPENEPVVLKPEEQVLIKTGLHMEIPDGYEVQLRPRSGLSLKNGISLTNSPGTIDSDYRGDIGIILINHGKQDFEVKRGDRIAQMILAPVLQADFEIVEKHEHLEQSDRGKGGFGSTGIKD